jgi:mannosyl-3-phosphoglycerate phosphatase
MASPIVIYTDLDGALLAGKSYSWHGAEEALEEIGRRRVPLVFCTSKTRGEVEDLRRKLGNAHPFITENGGGVFIPHGYFAQPLEGAHRAGHYHCFALGRPHAEIVDKLERIAAEAGAEVAGFHQMNAREIATNTGLNARQTERARAREFDEPFFFAGADAAAEQRFLRLARERGLQAVRGDRFWHLSAGSDKGRAVQLLSRFYRKNWRGHLQAVALGSSANDLPMLAAVDVAVLLPEANGSFAAEVLARLPAIRRANAPGPAGWNEAVLRILGA